MRLEDYSDADITQVMEWRKQRHLLVEREKWKGDIAYTRAEPHNVHFFNYDPSLGPTDLSNVSVKHDDNSDLAIFSIPQSFTESARSRYKSSDDRSRGLDIQAYMTPHNGPIFPLKK
jgi:hypothetical protein